MVGLNLELVQEDQRECRFRQPSRPCVTCIASSCWTAPALDLLTLNALVAADGLIIPMQCEYFALEGVSQLLETVEAVRENWNPALEVEGVLFTLYDERTNLSRQVAENLQQYFGDRIFTTSIPRNIRLAEAPSHGKPVILYDLRSRGAEAYLQLAQEVIEREQSRKQPKGARTRA